MYPIDLSKKEKNDPSMEVHHMEKGEDQSQQTSVDEEPETGKEFKLTFGLFMAILSFAVGYFSDTLVIIMLSAALGPINKALGPSSHYVWIVSAQTVGGAAAAPVVGRFGDIFGRRKFLLLGNMFAMVGTVMSATANNINVLIGGGVLIGLASGMRQLAWSALGEIVPKKDRGIAFGLLQGLLGCAAAFAPVIAYAFLDGGSWRGVFWLPFGLDCAALILVFFFYHPLNQFIHEEGRTTWDQVKDTDFVGCFLFVSGIVLFLLGISFGGSQYPWASAGTIVPLLVGIALLVVLGFYESHANLKYPIFPPEIFKDIRGFTVLQVATFLLGMLFYATAVIWPLQVQALYTQQYIKIGWYAGASGMGGVLTSTLWGYSMKYIGRSHIQLPFYLGCLTLCSGLQAIVSRNSHIASTALVALGAAFIAAVSVFSVSMVQVIVKHEHLGIASGVLVTARSLGGAVATTIYVSILQNKLASSIAPDVAVPLAENGVPLASIPAVIEALTSGDLTSPALAAISPKALYAAAIGLQNAYVGSFRLIYLVSIAFGVIGTVMVAFVRNVDALMTDKIDIKLSEGAHIRVQNDTGEGHIIRHTDEKA